MTGMTFQEFVLANASLVERLTCVFRGHSGWQDPVWHPCDETEDRHARYGAAIWCLRCGRPIGAKP